MTTPCDCPQSICRASGPESALWEACLRQAAVRRHMAYLEDLQAERNQAGYREVLWSKSITCDRCGGRAVDHGRNGECYRLQRQTRRHGQLESLR